MSNSEKVDKYLTEAKVFYLSTVDGDKPKCRPLGLHKLINDTVYFGIGEFKEVYKQLEKNPNCEIVAMKQGGGMEWIRINGKAIFESDYVLAEKILEENKFLQDMYSKNNWKLKIFHIKGTVEIRKGLSAAETYEI